jgi:hypothetical protein
MTRLLQILALLAALALPAFCQNAGLSADDQREFDKAYTKWVNDTRKNDRDDIAKDVRKMQDIMARNNIPANVPYDRIASSGQGYQGRSYQAQLSPEDQKDFDKAYTKWVNDTRKNDRDDIDKDVRKMEDIKARYNIPADTPYEQVASTGQGQYTNQQPYPPNGQARLSPEDQRDFDRYYSQWLDDSRRRDRDDANRDMQHMQDIMARYNIPSDVPPGQVATPGTYPRSDYNNGYSNNAYPTNAYPSNAYPNNAYPNSQVRLSPDDQRDFDKAYSKWVNDSRRNDRDDIDKDARKMQDIMARYNIPADVPYEQIASRDADYRH